MKTFLRKATSLLLSTILLSSLLAIPAAASDALGEDLKGQETLINRSTALSTNVFWSTAYSDLRTENLITYTPNTAVTPIIASGSVLTACNTVSSQAKLLEEQGYRVVAGLNGDFYNTTTGLPIGLVIENGRLKSSDGGYYAVGFRADGTAIMGKPAVRVDADLGYMGYDADGYGTQVLRTLAGVNKARVSTGGIYLYTYDFNAKHTTGNTEAGVDVVCRIVDGSLTIGSTVTLEVVQVVQASSATAIAPDQVVLSVNNQSNSYFVNALANETVGNTITLSVSAADVGWNDVQYAVGALYSLVQDGALVSGLPTGVNPRTAVGQKEDGTLVFYTIDGRQSGHSIGASLSQVGQRLMELGCVTAVCLDGGGSTTLTVTEPDATAAAVVNHPSVSTERAVSNQIFLVAQSAPSNVLSHFYVAPDADYVLAGSKVNITAAAVDTNYIPMPHYSASLSASAGAVAQGVLTTPAGGGDVTVTASGGGRTGSAVVHAIVTPDSITVKNGASAVTALTMTPDSTLDLSATATYNHLPLKADASAFTWTLTGDIGTVTSEGVLSVTTPGSGTLTVSAGGKSVSVGVTVSKIPLQSLEGFESGAPTATEYSYGATLSVTAASDVVKLGRLSGKLDYTLGADGTAALVFDRPYALSSSAYNLLNLWVRGDNSGNTLSLLISDGSATSAIDLPLADSKDWQLLSISLPAGTVSITGFKLTGTPIVTLNEAAEEIVSYAVPSGTLYLDQLTASYGGMTDTVAPTVSATLTGDATAGYTLSAVVSDGCDGILAAGGVAVTLDGKSIPHTYDAKTGKLTAAVAVADLYGHRISVFARDASGNIGRASCDLASSSEEAAFTDTADYWAGDFVAWMKTSGITTGYDDGTFRPNQNITRQQFAAMLFRYLGLDGAKYESVELPFADADKISSYAVTAVKALYSIGIIGGTEKNGQLYFYPGNSLTRAQAAAMIGRTQEKGYATVELGFSDAASIPAYAAYYIRTMAAQGVIGGYTDGTFRPNANITRGQMAKILYNLL